MVFTLLQRPLATHQLETCLLSKDYKNITSSLINQENDFFESVFEKFPCHFHPTSKPSKALCEGIFSAAQLYDVVKKTQLAVDSNIQSYRYLQGARKQREFKEEIITKAELDSAFKSNHSVQFFQPQRFSDHLHAIIAGFEDEFGSLAGASAYLTPPCSQGLAPHHDDVCVFILQTEGSKLWHLWAGEIELPEHHSDDISRASLSNTPPVEVLLQQGDVLYLPRGTIHEAISQDTFSTHVTISVYQKYNFKTLVGAVFEEALEKSAASNVELRKGLPLRISESFGTFAGLLLQDASTAGSVQASAGLGSIRAQMYAKVKGFLTEVVQQISENIVDTAVDQLVSDFALHRLPPPAQEVNEKRADTVTKKGKRKRGDEEEKSAHRNAPQLLSKESRVRLCDPRSCFFAVQEIEGVSVLGLRHNKNNRRLRHMGHPSDDDNGEDGEEEDETVFSSFLPIRLLPLVQMLFNRCGMEHVRVADIFSSLSCYHFDDDEVLEALQGLLSDGFLEVENRP